MFMGYIYITCHTCGREIKHHSRDVTAWPTRICPGCGETLTVSLSKKDEGDGESSVEN